jgi:hypothetical protein
VPGADGERLAHGLRRVVGIADDPDLAGLDQIGIGAECLFDLEGRIFPMGR